jgi:hypothetical protein
MKSTSVGSIGVVLSLSTSAFFAFASSGTMAFCGSAGTGSAWAGRGLLKTRGWRTVVGIVAEVTAAGTCWELHAVLGRGTDMRQSFHFSIL